ncbi:anthrone oxygenase family protein [Nonomuraea sp. NPDC049152]|uniref:anthrone oxygenase family protein n=1 Tax=Nonomuraea sp. NPDC049152 TaxID=3154350 RepID=UPI0033FD10FF
MMDVLRTLALIAATISMGMVSSVFALYAHTIMPGLKRTDDRTFVGAFQSIDRAIINPWFIGGGFLGALLFTIVAAATQLGRPAFLWIVVALVLYVVTFVITIAINVPRNDAIKAAGQPDQIDVAAVRQRFDEARWATFNLVRVVTSVPAFALLVWALILHGRSSV